MGQALLLLLQNRSYDSWYVSTAMYVLFSLSRHTKNVCVRDELLEQCDKWIAAGVHTVGPFGHTKISEFVELCRKNLGRGSDDDMIERDVVGC